MNLSYIASSYPSILPRYCERPYEIQGDPEKMILYSRWGLVLSYSILIVKSRSISNKFVIESIHNTYMYQISKRSILTVYKRESGHFAVVLLHRWRVKSDKNELIDNPLNFEKEQGV